MSRADGGSGKPVVVRVETQDGSRVEPPLNQRWDELTKLRWHAAVVELDTALFVDVQLADYRFNGARMRGYYIVQVGSSSSGPHNCDSAWSYISGAAAACAGVGHRRPTALPEAVADVPCFLCSRSARARLRSLCWETVPVCGHHLPSVVSRRLDLSPWVRLERVR